MPERSFSRQWNLVVVAGDFNPLIHHPHWYHEIGAITDEETAAALGNQNTGSTPVASLITFGSPVIAVQCLPNQWSVRSPDESSWPKMLRLTSLVFDQKNGLSLTTYAFAFQRHIDTEAGDVKAVLGEYIAGLGLGFPAGETTGGNISSGIAKGNLKISCSIQNSVLGGCVVFGLYRHQYEEQNVSAIFDGRFDQFSSQGQQFFSDIVGSINRLATKR